MIGALGALAAFGAALMASTGITMFRAARLSAVEILVAAAAFSAVALLRLPVPAVLAVVLPISVWLLGSGPAKKKEDAR